MNNFNKNDYFVISERYANDKYFSKKIKISIKNDINQDEFIKMHLEINNSYSARQKNLDIIKITRKKINVMMIENQWLTIYIRFPNIDYV